MFRLNAKDASVLKRETGDAFMVKCFDAREGRLTTDRAHVFCSAVTKRTTEAHADKEN